MTLHTWSLGKAERMCKRPSIRRFLRQRLQYINKVEQSATTLSTEVH
jgi:hypothetical protein